MIPSDPTLAVLLFASLAAASAFLGALPLLGRRAQAPQALLGWSNALAAGLMLGSAFVLSETVGAAAPWASALGAALGTCYSAWARSVSGGPIPEPSLCEPAQGYQALLVATLHSASEGIAIGAAMAADLSLGIFTALAIAVHNVPEGLVLGAVLRGHGVTSLQAGALAVAANISQVLFAVSTFAVISAAPAILPWILGFAVGALVFLILTELLPEAYREAGASRIALVTSVAMSLVVLLRGLVP
ncbi:MAG: ZIP family metal transporter [Acidobacteriota bacterium]